jgi:hypothetical protein
MAGSVVTTRTSNAKGKSFDVIYTLLCTGDSGDGGSVPAETIKRLEGYRLTELQTVPGAGAAQPDAYDVTISDADSGTLLSATGRSQTAKEFVGGHETLGYYPKIDGTISIAVTDLGNSNEATLKLKFEKGVF